MSISTQYMRTAPSAQNELAIFKNRWFSQLLLAGTCAGQVALFEDPRIAWAISQFGNLEILAYLRHFGYTEIATNFEQPEHVEGPAFALIARKA